MSEIELARETVVIACTTLELVRARQWAHASATDEDVQNAERTVDNAARLLVLALE